MAVGTLDSLQRIDIITERFARAFAHAQVDGLTDVTRGFVEPEFYEVKPTTPTGVTPTAMPSGQAPSSSRPTSSAQPAATPKK